MFEFIAFRDLSFETPNFLPLIAILQNIFRKHIAFLGDFHLLIALQIITSETRLLLHLIFFYIVCTHI